MTIKAKILVLVAAFALMAAAISALALKTMADYNRVIDDYARTSDDAFRGERLNLLISQTIIDLRSIYASRTPQETEHNIAAMDGHIDQTQALLAQWAPTVRAEDVPNFHNIAIGCGFMAKFGHTLAGVAREKGPAEAQRIGFTPKQVAVREMFQSHLDAMVATIEAKLKKRQDALRTYQTRRMTQFVIIAASGTLLLLVGSLWIAIRTIANPLKTITRSVIRISEGAYDTTIPNAASNAKSGDEIARLWAAIAVLKDRAIELKRINDAKLELHLD